MGIRQFKPVTKGTRFRSISDFAEITRSTPEKSLVEPLKKSGGRDNHGHISMRRRGGGHKRQYRIIDFKRNRFGDVAVVQKRLRALGGMKLPVPAGMDPNRARVDRRSMRGR